MGFSGKFFSRPGMSLPVDLINRLGNRIGTISSQIGVISFGKNNTSLVLTGNPAQSRGIIQF